MMPSQTQTILMVIFLCVCVCDHVTFWFQSVQVMIRFHHNQRVQSRKLKHHLMRVLVRAIGIRRDSDIRQRDACLGLD